MRARILDLIVASFIWWFLFLFRLAVRFEEQWGFFLPGFSFTVTENSQDSRGREGTVFYSPLPLPPAHEHSVIYLPLSTWDDYHILLIAPLVFTRLLLDETYHLIELLVDWLIDIYFRLLACWFNFKFFYNYLTWETRGY